MEVEYEHINTFIGSYRLLTCSLLDSEISIDFVQNPFGSRRERVNKKTVNIGYCDVYNMMYIIHT